MGAGCEDLPAVGSIRGAWGRVHYTTIGQVDLRESVEIFPGIPECETYSNFPWNIAKDLSRMLVAVIAFLVFGVSGECFGDYLGHDIADTRCSIFSVFSLEGSHARLGLEWENDGRALHDRLGLKELPVVVFTSLMER